MEMLKQKERIPNGRLLLALAEDNIVSKFKH